MAYGELEESGTISTFFVAPLACERDSSSQDAVCLYVCVGGIFFPNNNYRYIWWNMQILPSRPKRCSCYARNLWGYWTNFGQFAHDVATILPLNIF